MRTMWPLVVVLAICCDADASGARDITCPSLPGADAVVASDAHDFVVVGESHGTVQMPALFADLVCVASMGSRPLIVGVEMTSDNQPALDAFLAARDVAAARTSLHAAPAWQARDARATQAIADLLWRVRELHATGASLRLLAFDDASVTDFTSPLRETKMAVNLMQAHAAQPAARVLAFTGRGHADRRGWTSATPPFQSMVEHLPPTRTLALAFARAGGATLACERGTDGVQRCAPTTPRPAGEPPLARGVHPGASTPGFDDVLSTGAAYTASTPLLPPPAAS